MKPKHIRTILILAITFAGIIVLETSRRATNLKNEGRLESQISENTPAEPSINDFILYKSVIKHLSISIIK